MSGVGTIDSKRILDAFEAHLLDSALAPATVVNYMADLRAFLRWCKETKPADVSPLDADASDIRAYCRYLRDIKNHAPATVNRRLQALRKFFTLAVEQGWTPINPADGASLMTETVSQRSRFLTSEDVARLLDAVRHGRPRWVHRDWAIMVTFLEAGLKLSELTLLRLADVHLDADEPSLDVRGPSSEPVRTIPLAPELSDAFGDYLPVRRASAGVEHVFVNRDGNPLSTRSVQRLLHHYAREADLPGLTTQALRYQYATKVYESSDDLETVAHLLGHRHLATTIRYLRPSSPREELPSGPQNREGAPEENSTES